MKKLFASLVACSALIGGAQARDLTVVSWGGNYQDADYEVVDDDDNK